MRRQFILAHDLARKNAIEAIKQAPDGYFVDLRSPTRSLEQNNRLWALLADISKQVEWYGRKLSTEEWKHIFTSALRKQDVVPNLDGTGFVVLGLSTSSMGKKEMADLQTLIESFGAERNVMWSDNGN